MVAGAFAELDVIAFVQGQTRACVCVLHYSGGTLQDKEYTFFHVTESDPAEVLSSFIKQYYAQRNAVAKTVLLSHEIEEQDAVGEYLSSIAERKVELAVPQARIDLPQKGELAPPIAMCRDNAAERDRAPETKHVREHGIHRSSCCDELAPAAGGYPRRPCGSKPTIFPTTGGQRQRSRSMVVFCRRPSA